MDQTDSGERQNQSHYGLNYRYQMVQLNRHIEPGVDVITHTHKVNASQQSVIHRTGCEFALQLSINREVF